MLTTFSRVPTANGQDTKVTIGGQFIAKATVNYPKWQRAEDAARWMRGQLTIEPTLKLASQTFDVSIPLIVEARKRLEQLDRGKRRANGSAPTTLSDPVIDNIVAAVGPERVMRALDRLTQPSLPLVAAE